MMTNAELYHKSNTACAEAAMSCLDEYNSKINWKKHNDSAVDLGSADGRVTSIIKSYMPCKDAKFVGCDISVEMVKFAKEHYSEENIEFRVQDIIADMPEDMKSNFNHVFSFFTLNCVPNHRKAFSNIYDIMAPGGDCFLFFLKYVPIYELISCAAEETKWKDTWLQEPENFISPYYDVKDPEQIINDLLKSIGFINIEVKRKEILYRMENGLEVKNLMRSVLPFGIPDKEFEELAQDCVTTAKRIGLLDQHEDSFEARKTPIDYKYNGLIVFATKPI